MTEKDKIQELNEAFIAAKEAATEASAAMTSLSATFTYGTGIVDTNGMALNGGSPTYNLNQTFPAGGTLGGVWPSTTAGVDWLPMETCLLGHVANADDIEYVDGVIVSHCIGCNVRMQMNRVSGGVALLRIQHLLGRVMSIDDETKGLEGFDVGQILADFTEIHEALEKDEFAMRQARKLFDLASQVLSTKVSYEEG